MRWGGLILCGGLSLRMGSDKAGLRFGTEPLLLRVLRLISEGLGPVPLAVAAAKGQVLPELPQEVLRTFDEIPHLGPLEGLRAGLSGLSDRCDAVVVTSCDAPLLVPAVLPILQGVPGEWDAVVVGEPDGRLHPLCSAWRMSALPFIRQQRDLRELGIQSLFKVLRTKILPSTALLGVDPRLDTLCNINDPCAFAEALQRAGLS
jgi:molybdopterin-guanine dinucleotide biosynthesis protein A